MMLPCQWRTRGGICQLSHVGTSLPTPVACRKHSCGNGLSENPTSKRSSGSLETVAIIDFETTGLSPNEGERATEIAAIVLQDGRVVRQYQSLMNAGIRISSFITSLTGITNQMVQQAPPAARVMGEVADFVGDLPLVAHNASFDRKFWDAELARIGRTRQQEFACTMLTARRVYPTSPNHKLGTLAAWMQLPDTGKSHRAMADAEMTAHLLCHIETTLVERFKIPRLSHALLRALQQVKSSEIRSCIEQFLMLPAPHTPISHGVIPESKASVTLS